MTDFKIRRGLSTTLFSPPGTVNPKLIIEEGCWYLCSDTAELFLGVSDSENNLTLKRINNNEQSITEVPSEILTELTEVKNTLQEQNNRIADLVTKTNEQDSDINAIQEDMAAIKDADTGILALAKADTRLQIENLALDTVKSNIVVLDKKINDIESYVATITGATIASFDLPGLVKASEELHVEEDGKLIINEVSTDKLIQGAKTLVLSAGTSSEII